MDDRSKILRAIEDKAKETRRLEFKRVINVSMPSSKAEFIRDVISLANSEGEIPRESGYLVIGVKDGHSYGISDTYYDGATFRQLIRSYIAPELPIEYAEWPFNGQHIGVITVAPSATALYVVRKDFSDSARPLLRAGQCWGRKGDEKVRLSGDDIATRISDIARTVAEEHCAPIRSQLKEVEQILLQSGPVADVRRIGYTIELESDWQSVTAELTKVLPYIRDYPLLVVPEVLRIATECAGRISGATPINVVANVCGVLRACLPSETSEEICGPKRTVSVQEQEFLIGACRIAAEVALDGCRRLKKVEIIDCTRSVLQDGLRFCHVNGLESAFHDVDRLFNELSSACARSDDAGVRSYTEVLLQIREWQLLSREEQERRMREEIHAHEEEIRRLHERKQSSTAIPSEPEAK
jgi:hypothetical protein